MTRLCSRLTTFWFRPIVGPMRSAARAMCLFGIVVLAVAAPASTQPTNTVGQISGVASIPGKGTLAGVTAQLRDLTTKQIVGTIKTNASGQFVFVVDRPGNYIVEIVDDKGLVVGTTAPIVLAPGAMIASTVTVSPSAGGATVGTAGGAVAASSESGQGSAPAAGARAGGVSSNVFMPTLPSVSSAATGSGVAAGTVPSRGTVSPSR